MTFRLAQRPACMPGGAAGATYCDGERWQVGCGFCGACGGAIPDSVASVERGEPRPRSRWFCSVNCSKWWRQNHFWSAARHAAIRRDGKRCVLCHAGPTTGGGLEVNHKTPLAAQDGAGYETGCQHHQEGLETLCHRHHLEETARQALERREAREKPTACAMI